MDRAGAATRMHLGWYAAQRGWVDRSGTVSDVHAAGVPWHCAGTLCVTYKQGAYPKARRLQAEQLREPGERRTPEVARCHEDRAASEV